MKPLRPLLLIACALGLAGNASADTVTLVSDRDNTLYESATGAVSNGAGPTMFAGRTAQASNSRRRAVIRFDVAGALPAGSTISSVTLALHVSQAASPTAADVELRRALADWGEGTSNGGASGGAGAAAATGDATWIHRFFPGTLWANAGGDFAGAATSSIPVGDVGTYVWPSSAAMVADLQGWLDSPASNFGWGVIGNEAAPTTAKRFDTREIADPASRPALTVTFTPPGTPAKAATWGAIRARYR